MCEWRERLQLRQKVNRAIKGEVLHSQWNILRFPSRSQPSVHSFKYLHIIEAATRDTPSFKITTAVQQSTNLLQRYTLFIGMTSLEDFYALASVKVFFFFGGEIYFAFFLWKISNCKKARGLNETVFCSLLKEFGGIGKSHHPLGNINSTVVKFRQKCRHKNTPYHIDKTTKALKPAHSDWKIKHLI